jgi:NAD(P)-dependent dehydrogenase (short-subunit alcohol dehydrogenase family)
MQKSPSDKGKILITGGTSGLGLALVRFFLKRGYTVVATGRKKVTVPEYENRLTFLMTDFSNLRQTSDAIKRICIGYDFDIVINNAGVLSPPGFMLTEDGNEYSFQVNFLSHLILNEIIIRNSEPGRTLKIAATVSLAYRIAENDLIIHKTGEDYRPLKAYSNSKLYLVLMCSWLPRKYHSLDLRCIGFDPGVFSSEIYRMQKEWFRSMYGVAAPFMRDPEKIACRFAEIIEREDLVNGAVYKTGKQAFRIPLKENRNLDLFWKECYELIEPYLDS